MKPTKVVKLVGVVCPNRYGIHDGATDGVYVRYALLFDKNGGCTWIDDPNIFDLQGIIFDTGIQATWVHAHCPWCLARAEGS